MNINFDDLFDSISNDKIEYALQIILLYTKELTDKEYYHQAIMLNAKLVGNNKQAEILESSQLRLVRAQVRHSLIDLCNELSSKINKQNEKSTNFANANIYINNLNLETMEFHNSNFHDCTFNEYKDKVIQVLKTQNKFSEVDFQMFTAIEKIGKNDTEKKELFQAVEEIKLNKDESAKTPFKAKIISFLKDNKEILKTVLKIGVSAIIGHYGLQGADKLLGLTE